ncbi:MAG: 2-phospho-L-lactate transferase [Methanocellales archaeon]|nr:2-phospho-L-lactate transferase [Methanocellales archaeon]
MYFFDIAEHPMEVKTMIILSGGTGTPKLLNGLKSIVPEENIAVIVNTAEDRWVSGNLVCPDIDTVLYTFADLIDESKWWGIKDDTFYTHEALKKLGYHESMKLGDQDRATHILRSELIRDGLTLTQSTDELRSSFRIKAKILPMSDDPVATMILTQEGEMHFQDFWITHKGKPEVLDVRFEGLDKAEPTPEVMNALSSEDAIIIGPSNPITSIGPILGLKGIRSMLQKKRVIAISPIIGDEPVSGPAGKLMAARGYEVSSAGVAQCYADFLDVLVVDQRDDCILPDVKVVKTDTMMSSVERSIELARFIVGLVQSPEDNSICGN